MFDSDLEFNTVRGQEPVMVDYCKLLFTNISYQLRSVDVFFDDIFADRPYRLIRSVRLSLFDTRLLPILLLADSEYPVSAAIAYSYDGDTCQFVCSGEYSPSSYAAPVLSLFYRGEIRFGQTVIVRSRMGEKSATVAEDGILIF